MPGIIDSLVITLGFDTSGMTKGQKDATEITRKLKDSSTKDGKAIEEAFASTTKGVEALTRKFLGLFALVTAGKGLQQFVSDLTTAESALGRVAKSIDLSAKGLSTWQNAAVVAGGSAEGITGVMRSLSGELQRAALTGTSSVIPAFRALGINLADTKGHARDVRDILTDLNRRAQGMDPAKFGEIARMAGIGDEATISMLQKSTMDFDRLIAAQEKYATTSEDVEAAQQRQSSWRELLITSTAIGRTILTSLTPAIVGAMKAVQGWADANQEWIRTEVVEKIGQFADYLKSLDWSSIGKGVQDFAGSVATIAGAVASAVRAVDGSSPFYRALEGIAVLAGVRIVGAVGAAAVALTRFGSLPLPPLLSGLLMNPAVLGTLGVGAVLASGDHEKSVLAGGRPDVQPQDNDLGLPGVGDRGSNDTSRPEAVGGGMLGWIKENWKPDFGKAYAQLKAMGFGDKLHDDPKTKENIEDTAKATRELRDLVKNGASLTGNIPGIPAAAGGGTANLRYGRAPGGFLRGTPGSEIPKVGATGISVDTKLRDLDERQRQQFLDANHKAEGNPGARPDYNNPGNIMFGSYARSMGATSAGLANVARFPTREMGEQAERSLFFGKKYRDLSIRDAMRKYTPAGDGANNPDRKAAQLAAAITPATADQGGSDVKVAGDSPEVAEARRYLTQTATGAARQRSDSIVKLNPAFALAAAKAIKQARAEGINAGIFSGYRKPTQTGSNYDAEGFSSHSYGIASDFSGVGTAGSAQSRRFDEIARAAGLGGYGPDNPREFNHKELGVHLQHDRDRLARMRATLGPNGEMVDPQATWAASGYVLPKGTAEKFPEVQAPAPPSLAKRTLGAFLAPLGKPGRPTGMPDTPAPTQDMYDAAKRVLDASKFHDMDKATADQRRAVELANPIIAAYEKLHPREPSTALYQRRQEQLKGTTNALSDLERSGHLDAAHQKLAEAMRAAEKAKLTTRGKPLPSWMAKDGTAGGITTVDYRDPKYAPKALDPARQKLADAMRAGSGNPIKVELGHSTLGHLGREFLRAVHHSQRLTAHRQLPGMSPIPHRATAQAAEHARIMRTVAAGPNINHHSAIHNVDQSTSMDVRGVTIHSAATNGKDLMSDLRGGLEQRRNVVQAQTGLA